MRFRAAALRFPMCPSWTQNLGQRFCGFRMCPSWTQNLRQRLCGFRMCPSWTQNPGQPLCGFRMCPSWTQSLGQRQIGFISEILSAVVLRHKLIEILDSYFLSRFKSPAPAAGFGNRPHYPETLEKALILYFIVQRRGPLCPGLPGDPPFQFFKLLYNVTEQGNRPEATI